MSISTLQLLFTGGRHHALVSKPKTQRKKLQQCRSFFVKKSLERRSDESEMPGNGTRQALDKSLNAKVVSTVGSTNTDSDEIHR